MPQKYTYQSIFVTKYKAWHLEFQAYLIAGSLQVSKPDPTVDEYTNASTNLVSSECMIEKNNFPD